MRRSAESDRQGDQEVQSADQSRHNPARLEQIFDPFMTFSDNYLMYDGTWLFTGRFLKQAL
jgi:hypothetical protein